MISTKDSSIPSSNLLKIFISVQVVSLSNDIFSVNRSLVERYSLDCRTCYSRATFGLAQQNRIKDIHEVSALVMQWMSKNVKVKDNDTFVLVLDSLFINAVRGKPDSPMQFANRISDKIQKVG